MKSPKNPNTSPSKTRTGIEGFDDMTQGGLPRGRTTLLEGGPGAGKTIMALQWLVNGARIDNEPGIFIAFEESPGRIQANASKFGWNLAALQKKKLFFLDAQPTPDLFQSGSFDLGGMLAAIESKVGEIKARRIVLDAIDIVLAVLNDPIAAKKEIYHLHEWLQKRGLTAVITSKSFSGQNPPPDQPNLAFMQFMVDCAVTLNHEVVQGVSQRNVRVQKYRGSGFSENESPFLIGPQGMEVAGVHEFGSTSGSASNERVSSGVLRLDAMLGGGYYRGSSILVTGFPGTAKSTLSGAFAEVACERGEETLFVSFDSDASEIVRNLASVNIRLARFVKSGQLRLISARACNGSAEVHLMRIKNIARQQGTRCLVVDPISAFSKAGNEGTAHSVAERLIDWAKAEEITILCTSLLEEATAQVEGTPLQISTIADTWIHLNYLVQAGERNRGISIIKSRGTAHSNQVRELLLDKKGVTLADAYTAGGEVLMGTLRWEKENAVRSAKEEADAEGRLARAKLAAEEVELDVRCKKALADLEAKRSEIKALAQLDDKRHQKITRGRLHMHRLRGVDKT